MTVKAVILPLAVMGVVEILCKYNKKTVALCVLCTLCINQDFTV